MILFVSKLDYCYLLSNCHLHSTAIQPINRKVTLKQHKNSVAYGIPESCEEAAGIQMFVKDRLSQSYNLLPVNVLEPQQLGNYSPKPGDRPRPALFLTDSYKVKKEIVARSRELKGNVQFHFDQTKAEREKTKTESDVKKRGYNGALAPLPTETSPTINSSFSSSFSVDADNSDAFHSCSSSNSTNKSCISLPKVMNNNYPVSRKKVLELFYMNIDTVTNKLPELKLEATTEDFDILCTCELTLKNPSSPLAENQIRITGYHLFSNLSINPERGTAIYTKEGINVRDLSFNHNYSLWIESVFVWIINEGINHC